jgi:predicted phosphodiesterase
MRLAVISDIHGNRQALEAVLDDVVKAGVAEIWCLGDIVGYGASPDECCDLTRGAADRICLVGNHDMAVRGDLPLDEFSRGAELAARWTQEHLRQDNLDYLLALQPQELGEDVGLYHASPRDAVWEYVLSPLQAELCLDVQRHRVCLVGHSHVALSFSRQNGEAASGQTRPGGSEIDISGGEWILNPGSVGQPRDGDPRAAWLLLDTDAWTASFQRTEYDIAGAAAAIRAAHLPDSLAERLGYGQ